MSSQEQLKAYVAKSMKEAQFDIDLEFCKRNQIKLDNHEIDASTVALFDTKSNKAAFDLVHRTR